MRMAVLMMLALAGCGGLVSQPADNGVATARHEAPVDDGKADCAIDGAAQWTRDCLVERDGDQLTIRHADGGFRRFRVLADGRGLEAADGAEAAIVRLNGDRQIEVAAGKDRYRLPARIAGQ